MIPVLLDALRLLGKVAVLLAMTGAILLAVAYLMGEVDRLRLRRRGRRAAKAYGLHLVQRDNVIDASDRFERRGGGEAA